MKLIMLGATGFIGSNILPQLVAAGCDVYAVTRNKGQLNHIDQPHVRWVTLDELAQGKVVPHIDSILSVAGVGAPSAFEADLAAGLIAERGIADKLSELASQYQVKNVVYVSSGGSVYGEGWNDGEDLAFTEDAECRPIAAYGRCKLEGERRLTEQLQLADHPVGLTILRASNVYGPHYAKSGRQGLINALVDSALQNRPITIYGDGQIYRDYIYSTDLAHAILKALHSDAFGIYNIAAGVSHSITEVVEELEAVLGASLEKHYEPSRGFDIKYSSLSILRAQQILIWTPEVNLNRGIGLLLKDRRKLLEGA